MSHSLTWPSCGRSRRTPVASSASVTGAPGSAGTRPTSPSSTTPLEVRMSEMFTPIGERARWRVIYELMRGADMGVTITYEDMATPLGLDPVKDRHALEMAARKAD